MFTNSGSGATRHLEIFVLVVSGPVVRVPLLEGVPVHRVGGDVPAVFSCIYSFATFMIFLPYLWLHRKNKCFLFLRQMSVALYFPEFIDYTLFVMYVLYNTINDKKWYRRDCPEAEFMNIKFR
jgi:hypothetical protein